MVELILYEKQVELALIHPQIAPNAGNVARLCVATGTPLHLVRPMGFVLSDRQLKRSAMDYWPRLQLTMHDDANAFFAAMKERSLWLFDSAGETDLWDANFKRGDCLIFGSETRGLDPILLQQHRDRTIRIPQIADERCLNLSTAAGVALYEALRQIASRG